MSRSTYPHQTVFTAIVVSLSVYICTPLSACVYISPQPVKEDATLYDAVFTGDITMVNVLFAMGLDPTQPIRMQRGQTRSTVDLAIRRGHDELASMLLDYGATPGIDAQEYNLIIATNKQMPDTLSRLLRNFVPPLSPELRGYATDQLNQVDNMDVLTLWMEYRHSVLELSDETLLELYKNLFERGRTSQLMILAAHVTPTDTTLVEKAIASNSPAELIHLLIERTNLALPPAFRNWSSTVFTLIDRLAKNNQDIEAIDYYDSLVDAQFEACDLLGSGELSPVQTKWLVTLSPECANKTVHHQREIEAAFFK